MPIVKRRGNLAFVKMTYFYILITSFDICDYLNYSTEHCLLQLFIIIAIIVIFSSSKWKVNAAKSPEVIKSKTIKMMTLSYMTTRPFLFLSVNRGSKICPPYPPSLYRARLYRAPRPFFNSLSNCRWQDSGADSVNRVRLTVGVE